MLLFTFFILFLTLSCMHYANYHITRTRIFLSFLFLIFNVVVVVVAIFAYENKWKRIKDFHNGQIIWTKLPCNGLKTKQKYEKIKIQKSSPYFVMTHDFYRILLHTRHIHYNEISRVYKIDGVRQSVPLGKSCQNNT